MKYKMYKERAEDLINCLYGDCRNFKNWDTTDEDNWEAMQRIIEQLADHYDLKLYEKEEK